MKQLLKHLAEVNACVVAAKRTYLMLDYDGTLTPIVTDPSRALLNNEMRRTLRGISKKPSCTLSIVSGRSLQQVRVLVGIRTAYYMGNHGLEISGPNLSYVDATAQKCRKNFREISRRLRHFESIGAWIEDKHLTLTVHYRNASPRVVPAIKDAVQSAVHSYPNLNASCGKKTLEIRPRTNWNKGTAANWLIKRLGKGLPIYVGDDRTDEDAFSELRDGITILVSRRWKSSLAKYRLDDPRDVDGFLRRLALWLK
jgi:trehalose 6-phosphate phosphatase